jgi:2-polyprenyl-3-methyl-5-hydroxy-6-metoxy-1,4-benzoquinol methylase
MVPHGARVLDVGCGTGSVSLHVAANTGAQIIGVEPDERRAALARERGLDVRAEMLTDDLLARLGSFDVVMFADVLEHLPAAPSSYRCRMSRTGRCDWI